MKTLKIILKSLVVVVVLAATGALVYFGFMIYGWLGDKDMVKDLPDKLDDTVFAQISKDIKEGTLKGSDASRAIIYASLFYDDKDNQYKGKLPDGTSVDIRPQLQELVNEYDWLDDDTRSKVLSVVFPEQKITTKAPVVSPLSYLSGIKVYADDELFKPFEFTIYEYIVLKSFELDFMESRGYLVSNTVMDSVFAFEALGFAMPFFKIEIIPTSMPEFMTSYSVMIPTDFADLTSEPVYKIYIDFERAERETEAALVHELFHAFQEAVLFTYPGVVKTGAQIDWLKEATAAWAIDQVYPDNDFEIDTVPRIYEQPWIEYYSINTYDKYTWYQLFFYITEVLGSRGDDYVYRLFSSYNLNLNMDTVFNYAHGARMHFNQDFAKLGMALFGGVDSYMTFESQETSYPSQYRIYIDDFAKFELSEIADTYDAGFREKVFTSPGFEYIVIKIPQDFSEQLIFQQNLSMTHEEQYTGMRIAVKRDGQWQWENISLEPAMHVVDIGGSFDVIDEVLLMLYSTGFEQSEKMQYKVTTGTPTKAQGSIIVKWEKDYNSPDEGYTEKEVMTVVLSETLEKTSLSSQLGDETIMQLAFGENYEVTDLSIDYIYNYSKKGQDREESIIGSGSYIYVPGSGGEGISMPSDISGALKDAIKGLEDLTEEYKEFIPELPKIPDLEIPGLEELFGGGSALSRIVIRPELGVFELRPSMPPDVLSKDWVTYQNTVKYPDPEKPNTEKTDTEQYNGRPSVIFPLWFSNPNYSEDFVPPDESLYADDTEAMNKMMIDMQKSLNKLNIQALIDDPQIYYTMDARDMIEPRPVTAQLKQQAMFNRKLFTASLQVDAVTQKGNVIRLTIEIRYEFK